MKKIVCLMLFAIPLCLQTPYLRTAWQSSRLDQWDWIFALLALPAIGWVCRKEKAEQWDLQSLILLIPMLLGALTPHYHKVNALAVAASVMCLFAAVWLVASWRFASRILPAAMILLLGTPSSSYAISLLLMCPVWMAWMLKFLLAIACLIGTVMLCRSEWVVKKGTLCFLAAVFGSCLLLWHSKEIYFEGKGFIPDFVTHAGEFWGRSIEPSENTKRFFVSSTVKQFRYTKNDVDISVLAVKCGSDIHEIHPASHCLRTSFWTIHSEKVLYLQDNFAVTEIDAEKGARRFLIWVWYSSDRFSTPGFLGFRRHFRNDGTHYTFQISTQISLGIEESRAELQQFIRSFNGNGMVHKKEMGQ